jgi:glycosyltransferase involved in cell wall biosynthesis
VLVGIEEWLVARLRVLERLVPEAWRTPLKHLVRWSVGWLAVPVAMLRYGYTEFRCSYGRRPRGSRLTVVIVEPHLGNRPAIGHELPFSLTLAARLRQQDIDVHVLAHRRASRAVLSAFEAHGIPCQPLFRHSGLGIVPADLSEMHIGALGRFVAHAFGYAADLTLGLARSGVGSPRLLFFPTSALSCMTGSALVRWRFSDRARGESQIHVLHCPLFLGGIDSYPVYVRRRLRPLFRRGLHLGTVNPYVNAHLRALGEAEAISIPIPRPVEVGRWASPSGAPPRLGFLGSASVQKGSLLLPALLRRLLERHASLRVVVQVSAYTDAAAIGKAMDEVRQLAASSARIELIEQPLATERYYDVLRGIDVIVLPYDPKSYALSISAVAVEAMALGKVIVGPDVGWFADQRAAYGAYLATDTGDTEQLASRVIEAVDNLDRLAQQGERDAPKFAWHNVQSLVAALTEVAARDGLGPERKSAPTTVA